MELWKRRRALEKNEGNLSKAWPQASEVGGELGPQPRLTMGGIPQTQGGGLLVGPAFAFTASPHWAAIARVLLCLVLCHILQA